ncbi:MAG: YihA family ribosome biogenesis GTP-binding protein [Gemmatimonadetes bacterium]|nr:YihA family ribosome biogenesis GTP-binding protein [Gemmatimonadota bacterium]
MRPRRLKVEQASFVRSVTRLEDRPLPRLPEIAFSGRSNVGKSSLLNVLLGRRSLALTSSRPGKTQTLNFFNVGETCYFVDLPGYGYAKAPAKVRRAWRPMIEGYLRGSSQLRGVIQLLDVRHPPGELDRAMLRFLSETGLPTLLVLTKVDKLGANERMRRMEEMRTTAGIEDEEQVVPFSAVTREGREDVLRAIDELVGARAARPAASVA